MLDTLGRFSDPALLIMVSLAGGDKHGYAMMEDIKNMTGTEIGPGTLYGALSRLEERGLIQPLPVEERRRPYRLTPEGLSTLEAQLNTLSRFTMEGLRRLHP